MKIQVGRTVSGGQQLLFKPKHRVVPIHGHVYRKLELEVSRTMDVESKVYLLSIIHARTKKKKGSRLRLCFWVVDEVPERNDWICESRYMSSSKCLVTCILRDFICP